MNYNRFFRHGDWMVFDDSFITDMDLSDCDDTIEGVCYRNLSFDDCLAKCQPSAGCNWGYYIKYGSRSFCVPIRDHRRTESSPFFRLIPRDRVNFLKNADTRVFINEKTFPFSPNVSNIVFYHDLSYLQAENKYIGRNDKGDLELTSFPDLTIKPLSTLRGFNSLQQYTPIRNGDFVIINIPNTPVSIQHNNGTLRWHPNITTYAGLKERLQIVIPNEPMEKVLEYNQKFYLRHDDRLIHLNNGKLVLLDTKNLQDATPFEFLPNFFLYYCQNGKCQELPAQNGTARKNIRVYQNKVLHRNSNCWSQCEIKNTKKNNWIIPLVILVGLAIFLGTIYLAHRSGFFSIFL